MANVIIVMGKTGTGKSRSIKTLDPTKTYIINVAGKDLPFREGRKNYNRDNKNMRSINYHKDAWEDVIKVMQTVVEKRPEVNSIVIDDIRHIMEYEFVERATEIGYTRFTQIGQHMVDLLRTAKELGNEELDIFLMFHTDDVMNGQAIETQKLKLVGKLVEEHLDPMELVTICLVTNVEINQNKTTYRFITNRTNINGIQIPAKSPEDMFPLYMDNDLLAVKTAIQNYYKGE